MYAITETSYRAVSADMGLSPGETRMDAIPQWLLDAIDAAQMRGERTTRLRDTDWTQMADAPLTAAQKVAMGAYRQALRDLPSAAGFPDVPWPSMPALGESEAGAVKTRWTA